MNSLDILRFLPSFLFSCWDRFYCFFSNLHSRRLYGNHFSHSLFPLLFYMHPFSLHAHPPSSVCKFILILSPPTSQPFTASSVFLLLSHSSSSLLPRTTNRVLLPLIINTYRDHFKLWLVLLFFLFSFPLSLVTGPQSTNLFSRSHLLYLSLLPL
ncbi:hypothetical protein F5H01DRAFT_76269 [Linnemannia elongata]|nr:hypothetical protein F5H01DRAFT_76269 [Linnemannia elongata]